MSYFSHNSDNTDDESTLEQLLQRFIVSAGILFSIIENPILKEIITRGITASWINDDLSRTTCLLAIKQIQGTHTFEVLAKAMVSVYVTFGIIDKIDFSTMDNGSNFVKSFKVYGNLFDDMDGNENMKNQYILENNDDYETSEVEAIDVNMLVNGIEIEDKSLPYSLPRHHRCSAHTLN
ncbi:hypothetical protein QTP88_020359 [Uroleucon formosanum]